MTTYYTAGYNGNITASANYKFADDAIETNDNIVRGLDGKLYFDGDPAIDIPVPKTQEEEIARIDAETSASIIAGFDYQIDGQTLHFSYDANDQQNFADTANVATLAQMGVQGLPDSITWNGWEIERDADGREASRTLRRIELTMTDFLGLYTQGALTHKATQMEIGSQRKAALYAAA